MSKKENKKNKSCAELIKELENEYNEKHKNDNKYKEFKANLMADPFLF